MAMDAGAPRCCVCGNPLRFDTDREGRTTEVCVCGYRGYLETRIGEVEERPAPAAASSRRSAALGKTRNVLGIGGRTQTAPRR